MANVPFDDLILLQGDVPEPGYIPVNDILPYRDQPGTHVALLDFLAEQGVTEFESVTLASRDEGWITIERANLTAEALLMPHVDGVRFAAENLHVSTWLKGVWRIIVVGAGQAADAGWLPHLHRPAAAGTDRQRDHRADRRHAAAARPTARCARPRPPRASRAPAWPTSWAIPALTPSWCATLAAESTR